MLSLCYFQFSTTDSFWKLDTSKRNDRGWIWGLQDLLKSTETFNTPYHVASYAMDKYTPNHSFQKVYTFQSEFHLYANNIISNQILNYFFTIHARHKNMHFPNQICNVWSYLLWSTLISDNSLRIIVGWVRGRHSFRNTEMSSLTIAASALRQHYVWLICSF